MEKKVKLQTLCWSCAHICEERKRIEYSCEARREMGTLTSHYVIMMMRRWLTARAFFRWSCMECLASLLDRIKGEKKFPLTVFHSYLQINSSDGAVDSITFLAIAAWRCRHELIAMQSPLQCISIADWMSSYTMGCTSEHRSVALVCPSADRLMLPRVRQLINCDDSG